MKKINVRFEKDAALDNIDVLIKASEKNDEVKALIDKISSSASENIAVADGNGKLEVIPASDIVLLSVNGKQVSIITENDRYTARQSLHSIEDSLDPAGFIRISRYEIVNLKKVIRYDFTLSGTLRIELTGGMETWASRRCIPQIRKRLSGKE